MSCFAGCLAGICGGSSVKASWKNHFDAFAAQDVPKILADYTDRSEVYVYDYSTGGLSTYKGLSGVTDLFNGLFKTLSDTSELAAPLIEVEQWRGGGMVFLVWLCPSSGYPLVTDTFIFDKGFKILRQNIVSFKSVHEAYWPPSTIHNLPSDVTGNPSVSASWDNHFAAFAEQDVGKILKDYTNRSLVQVYDFSATQNTKYKGLKGVTELFNGLFTTLSDTSGLKAPVIKVEQWEGGGMVFLVWMCDTSGLPLVTDTFIFDANFKILRQNIVSWPKAPPAKSIPTFLVSIEEQRELLEQFKRRCLHYSETYKGSGPLCFRSRAYQKMHPAKEAQGYIDADATTASPMLLGVCDGVSQIADFGLDASLLPRELLRKCEEKVASQMDSSGEPIVNHSSGHTGYDGPISLLQEAYSATKSEGATSVLLAVMDNSTSIHGKPHPMVGVVTLGDCELLLLRRGGKSGDKNGAMPPSPTAGAGPLQVVLHTEKQRIGGHLQTPLQLQRLNDDDNFDAGSFDACLDTIERGSGLHCTSAYAGDVLIMGSDGVFDNLFLEEVVEICNQALPASKEGVGDNFKPASKKTLYRMARRIVRAAHSKTATNEPTQGEVPPNTPVGVGGKMDDTSVVVAQVVPWTRPRREAWRRTRRRQQWASMFSCIQEDFTPYDGFASSGESGSDEEDGGCTMF